MLDLLNPRLSSQSVMRCASLSRRDRSHPLVRVPQGLHFSIFAPSGAGKGVSFVVPFLKTCRQACVVLDFKAENYLLTGRHRELNFGQKIVALDPYLVTGATDTYNPLDGIDRNDPHALDHCKELAKALVSRTGTEPDPHWNDSAEAWIAAVIAAVVAFENVAELRSLESVRSVLADPEELSAAIEAMCASTIWDGKLATMGKQLKHFVDKERASTLTTVARHLQFLDTPAIAANTRTSSFDAKELRSGRMSVFLILPTHMRAQSALLRVWLASLLRVVVQGGLQEDNLVHFVLDEAASLGKMDAINDAIDKYRGYGVRLQFYWQSIGQLKTCFPDGLDTALLSNTTQIFLGVNDLAAAEQVSNRLGETTIVIESGGRSRGRSQQATFDSQSPHRSSGSSVTDSTNWGQQARKLLKQEEVLQLPRRTAICFTPGVAPIRATVIRSYEEPNLGTQPSELRQHVNAALVLFKSAAACAMAMFTAALLTALLKANGVGFFARVLLEQ